MKKYKIVKVQLLDLEIFAGPLDDLSKHIERLKEDCSKYSEPFIDIYNYDYYDDHVLEIWLCAKEYESDEDYNKRLEKQKKLAEKSRERYQKKKELAAAKKQAQENISIINEKRKKILGIAD